MNTTVEWIKNPESNRLIRCGGKTWRRLVRDGKLSGKMGTDNSSTPPFNRLDAARRLRDNVKRINAEKQALGELPIRPLGYINMFEIMREQDRVNSLPQEQHELGLIEFSDFVNQRHVEALEEVEAALCSDDED